MHIGNKIHNIIPNKGCLRVFIELSLKIKSQLKTRWSWTFIYKLFKSELSLDTHSRGGIKTSKTSGQVYKYSAFEKENKILNKVWYPTEYILLIRMPKVNLIIINIIYEYYKYLWTMKKSQTNLHIYS